MRNQQQLSDTAGAGTTRQRLAILAILVIGVGLRALVSLFGYNYDFNSYRMVAEIVGRGDLVYMSTWRYNYAPIWFYVIRTLDVVASLLPFDQATSFRTLLIALLSFGDIAITATLYRRVGKLAALAFFLNPISIIISGYHNQFDNLALSIGLTAVQLFERSDSQRLDRTKLLALVLFGLSLTTKHLFFLFPVWLAFRQRGWVERGLVLGLPIVIFLGSFAPFWSEGSVGITNYVFLYPSGNNSPLYTLPSLAALEQLIPRRYVWYGGIIIGAWMFRREPLFTSALIYTGVLFALSPAMTNQYLAIPMALVVTCFNPAFGLYSLVATAHLLVDINGLQLTPPTPLVGVNRQVYYAVVLAAFWAGLIWMDSRRKSKRQPSLAQVPVTNPES